MNECGFLGLKMLLIAIANAMIKIDQDVADHGSRFTIWLLITIANVNDDQGADTR